MVRIILLLCLFCFKTYSMDFVAKKGEYQENSLKGSFIELDENQLKSINVFLKEITRYDPTCGRTRKVELPLVNRWLILKDKSNNKLEIGICFGYDKKNRKLNMNEISYIFILVTEKEKENMDQLVRTLEQDLQATGKKNECKTQSSS